MAIMRGTQTESKEAAKEEQVTIDFALASVVSIAPIKKGEILSMQNIWVKRPGKGGIPAHEFESLLGKRAVRDIESNTQLRYEDFA